MLTPSTLGERIAQARRELAVRQRRDVTQLDVARAIGATGASVSEWEANKKVPREEALAKLAAFLGVTPAYLRYGIPDAKSPAPLEAGGRFSAEKWKDVTEEAEADLAAEEAEQASTTARRKRGGRKQG